MVKHVFRHTGATVGLTSTSGVYVNDILVSEGDATGPRSARMVLRDPTVEIAVLETARGGLLREGLAFERSDIGTCLNVAPDHLGLKGIETVEDLAEVKSLIIETVRRDGTAVLNADDPLVVKMARRTKARVIWFSLKGEADMPVFLRRHIEDGGPAVVREPGEEGGTIVFYDRGVREVVMRAGDIPATLHGMAAFNIANALATVGICIAHEVPILTIRSALMSFQSSFEQNPGRLNVHDNASGFRVILDYAHNSAGLEALSEVVNGLRHRYKRTVAVLSIPGDRRDEDIIGLGRMAGGLFDELFFREDPGTRGRPRGEVMRLLEQGAIEGGAAPERVHSVPTEAGATAAALMASRAGDLLIITPTDVNGTWSQIINFEKAQSATGARPGQLAAAE
jgi:cyanophycin synthetase